MAKLLNRTPRAVRHRASRLGLSLFARGQTTGGSLEMKSGPWSSDDDDQLRKLARSGFSLVEITQEIQRSKSAIYARAVKLNIVVARDRNPMQARRSTGRSRAD
jgi:hypothetical protein